MTAKKKLSHRPKRRIVTFQGELGPYGNGIGERYVIWIAFLPRGQRDEGGYVAVVQKMHWGSRYWDTVHNPILFRKTRRLFPRADSECAAKNCLHLARK